MVHVKEVHSILLAQHLRRLKHPMVSQYEQLMNISRLHCIYVLQHIPNANISHCEQ